MACTKLDVKLRYIKRIDSVKEYEKKRMRDPHRKELTLEYQRRRRAKYPEKNRARQVLGYYVRTGKVPKLPCQICGSARSEAHHIDYKSPLRVIWLCREHHRQVEIRKSA